MVVDLAAFQQDIVALTGDEVVEKYYFDENAAHLTKDDVKHAASMIGAAYNVPKKEIELIITGSAKLGFTTVDKFDENGADRPAYSMFDANSDVDVAVIAPRIFEIIWQELSYFSSRQASYPWKYKKLGDYLIGGWLRPDHFPRDPTLRYVGEWWPTFDRITRSTRFGRRKVRGGLFYSREQLSLYLQRALRDLKIKEMSK